MKATPFFILLELMTMASETYELCTPKRFYH